MQLGMTRENFFVGDQSWIGSADYNPPRSITLDLAKFTKATHYPNGFLLSGIPLQENTTTGLFEPATTKLDGVLFSELDIVRTDVNPSGALFYRGVVRNNRLPVAITDAQKATTSHIIVLAA